MVMHGLMSGGWRRGAVSGPQRLQLDAWTAPDLSATAPALDSTQVQVCLAVLADLIPNPDRQVAEREAVLILSVLVGAISMARAVDDPDLFHQILTNAAAALKQRIPN